MTVGENIRKLRKEKGLTQKQLGTLSGINEVQIRRYELGGKNSNPKIETLKKIASALDVSVSDLYTFNEFQTELSTLMETQRKAEEDFRDNLMQISKMLNTEALAELIQKALESIRYETCWSLFYDHNAIRAFVGDNLVSFSDRNFEDKSKTE